MPDDQIVFSPSFATGLMIIPAGGGTPQPLTVPDASKNERTHRWPEALPNGKAVLFSIGWIDSPSNYDNSDIAVVSLDTKERKTLIHNSRMARYITPGYILFQRTSTLFAAAFDLEALAVTSPQFQVQDRIAGETSCGAGYFSIAQNGTLAAVPTSSVTTDSKVVILDRSGQGSPLPLPIRSYNSPRFSPDGKQLAFSIGDVQGASSDVWIYDLSNGALNRLTFNTHSGVPLWSTDGKKIVYTSASGNEGLNWKNADGSGEEQHLMTIHGPSEAASWSVDGNLLAYTVAGKADDIALLDVRNPLKSKPFLATNNVECCPSISPDGRWVAYVSTDTGRLQVFVTSFPDGAGKWQVSNEVGYNPIWTRSGKEILYVNGNRVMSVPVETTPTFKAGSAQLLFESTTFFGTPPRNSIDVSPDGKRIVVIQSSENMLVPKQINMFLHFSDLIRRISPTR